MKADIISERTLEILAENKTELFALELAFPFGAQLEVVVADAHSYKSDDEFPRRYLLQRVENDNE